ncbi:quinone oxidoreductase PIG3 [Protopterus annectens]|uniref:quinone oxidoreductase PIG3 n=1 Tax=Protopterus annectens TaxID=7888 RepID=UPI001CFB0FE4|nr:quinone oxidoreductase PIG3 [Protopterus annectens]
MLAVSFDQPGGPENLHWKEVPKPIPREGEVLIKVHATALNRADLLQRQGKYPPPKGVSEILGLEAAGVIDALGPRCKGQWSPGDHVMALLSGGGYAQYATVPEDHLMPVPNHMTLCIAAAIPEAWLTAYQLLHFVGRVQKGETVLIHAGASGVGTAAIQLARLAGAVPIVTAGTPEKLQMASKLGAAAGFNYKEEDFSRHVIDFTGGIGVDVILDCVGGTFWEKNVCCLGMDGRWILYGVLGAAEVHGDILGKLLAKRGNLLTSLLRSRTVEYKAQLIKSFLENAWPYFSDDKIPQLQLVIDSTFGIDKIADAHRRMEGNENIGKIVVEVASSQ